MEKRIRTKLVEVEEEFYIADDGTEFETAEQCMEYENTQLDKETRSKRVYFLIKPSVNQRLEDMVKRGEIASKNDLINKLIDNFLEDFIQQTKK